ncbi:MAG: NADPH:quinone reductase-like Zn-dependent oxidoreductase [Myxococcota bacterium]|jgi:NADPH:quinone reductase-like Zn-dependent oxidoreductase
MRIAITPRYGPPSILQLTEADAPTIGDNDLLVAVHASPVTAGDRRIRAADFPGISAVFGRLIMGLTGPRQPVQGTMFAGRVVAVGSSVTRFAVGDDVFGSVDAGAYAEQLVVSADGPVAMMPSGVGYAEAAAIPYGAGTALHFLAELADVQPGESVLILGASGGVGRYAVQIAKHLGAQVTAVCSRRSFELVAGLGADHLIDHATEDFTASTTCYDVIFDVADATNFHRCRDSLTPTGRYLTLYISVQALMISAWTAMVGGKRAIFAVSMGNQARTEVQRDLLAQGVIRPVIAERFSLEQVAAAHTLAETGVHGEVMVMPAPEPARLATGC